MKLKGKRFTPAMIVAMIALGVALSGTAVAGTAKLITSSQIKDGSITLSDINANARHALKGKPGAKGVKGDTGATGAPGKDGISGLVTRHYDYVKGADYPGAGFGGIATVACGDTDAVSQTKVAIAGGVQFLNLGRNATESGYVSETHITDSFPGRMNWDTGAPKADRLDGWIVRLNDTPSVDMRVWVTCVDASLAS